MGFFPSPKSYHCATAGTKRPRSNFGRGPALWSETLLEQPFTGILFTTPFRSGSCQSRGHFPNASPVLHGAVLAPGLPQLTLVRVSDSFEAIWPELASECGLDLVVADSSQEHVPAQGRPGSITAVNVAGTEETLGNVLTRLGRLGQDVAAVGASSDARSGSADGQPIDIPRPPNDAP